jgi:PTS system nitrogen regulatory IIA component
MNLQELVKPASIVCNADVSSKKRALELLAELLSSCSGDSDALDIFQHLTEREKLGSTGLGHGVALPHARTSNCSKAVGAFIKLEQGIDFDSPDNVATDLLFALMVPEHYTDEHLKILAGLAGLFSDEKFCNILRDCTDSLELYRRLTGLQVNSQAS